MRLLPRSMKPEKSSRTSDLLWRIREHGRDHDRYKKATELSEELLKELDERYKTATAISAELQKTLDQRYETAKKLSKELYEELDLDANEIKWYEIG